ncbi:signal peptidase I [uncultured Alistipes sp.]|uniref:signal peptidase I n=1 Tax=uncultured Alistipes sp. TaxID=538949 RepID=UPI002617F349|nr:signal peptidase I [uncultured Alistipes sp.]
MKTRNPHIRKTLRILGKILGMLMLAAIAAFWVPYIVRALFCDQFVVPSESMLPTLAPGDRILVNKLIVGARIYKKFDFSEGAALHSFRLPGFRKVRINDIVVFNVPQGYDRDKIEFRINYVYAKRCIGTPGDSVSIRNGRFRNNHWSGPIGDTVQQQVLARMPDSLFSPYVLRSMPFDDSLFGWTIKNMGPLHVPRAGDSIPLDLRHFKLYRQVIEYETGKKLSFENGARLDGIPVCGYTFRKNYYFFCGDNAPNSKDSRYWGFAPEEFIIGVVNRISYSQDPITGERRPERWWKKVE